MKKNIIMSITVSLVGILAASSIAMADTSTSSSKPQRQSPYDVAAQVLGKTADEIKQTEKSGTSIGDQLKAAGKLDDFKKALLANAKTMVDEKVASGKLTQDKADAMYAKMETEINGWDGTGNFMGKMGGKDGKDGPRENGMEVMGLSDAATVLGITEADLKTELKANKGETLYSVLEKAGKLDNYKNAVLKKFDDKINSEVTSGKLDKTKATKIESDFQTKLNSWDGKKPLNLGGKHGFDDKRGGGMNDVTVASTALGQTEDQIKTAIKSSNGKTTLYSMLNTAGKLDAYKTALTAKRNANIDKMVTDGKIDATKASTMKTDFAAKLAKWDGTEKPEMGEHSFGDKIRGGMNDVTVASTVLGQTEDQIKTAIKSSNGKTTLYSMLNTAGKLDAYKTALTAKRNANIDKMVTDGKIDATKASTMKTDFASKLAKWDGTEKPEMDGHGFGAKRGGGMNDVTVASTVLGQTEDQIKTAIKSSNGKTTLYSMLNTAGKLDAYKTALTAKRNANIDKMVTAGKLDATKASTMKTDFAAKLAKWDGTSPLTSKGRMRKESSGKEQDVQNND